MGSYRTLKIKPCYVGISFARLEEIFESLGMISPLSQSNTLAAGFALNRTQNSLQDIFKRLASGRKINAGKDDPAGLISSEQLSAELKVLEAETRSLQRANASANIAEGHASQLSSLYSDLNVLVVASANQAGMSDEEIAANQMQIDNTVASIERISGDAISSLDRINIPDGGNAKATTSYNTALAAAASVRSGGANDLASGNFEAAQTALKGAIIEVATARGRIGGFQKDVVGPQISSNQVTIENITEARSRIVDTDFAVEASKLARAKVLQAAGISVLKISQRQAASILDLLS